MGAAYSSLGRTKVLYATSFVLLGAKAKFLPNFVAKLRKKSFYNPKVVLSKIMCIHIYIYSLFPPR